MKGSIMEITGVLVDPDNGLLMNVSVERDSASSYKKFIECQYIDHTLVLGGLSVYVDDEGILNGKTPFGIPGIDGQPRLLYGKALIFGRSDGPSDVSCNIPLDLIRGIVLRTTDVVDTDGMTFIHIDAHNAFFEAVNKDKRN